MPSTLSPCSYKPYKRDITKTKWVEVGPGKREKVVLHLGEEIIRTANCGQFGHRKTAEFLGVVQAGWVFRCHGKKVDKGSYQLTTQHTFVAPPYGS